MREGVGEGVGCVVCRRGWDVVSRDWCVCYIGRFVVRQFLHVCSCFHSLNKP